MTAPVNRPTGLPSRIDPNNKEQVRQVLERLVEIVRAWNGETVNPGARVVTKGELDRILAGLQPR